MDRIYASGASGTAPSAPASPSSGYPTAGNPSTGTPATKPGPYWYHMITEEIRKVITDAGLTPDHTNVAQLSQAVQGLAGNLAKMHGQCRLAKSGANLVLSPFNGNKLMINGSVQTVPSAGVSLAATGLTAGTLYYIYAYMNAGVMTLEASAAGHSTDATTGVEIKTGDATRTLVGMARPITGPAWQDTKAQRFVRSWFNSPRLDAGNYFAANRTTASGTPVELSSTERMEFLLWAGELASMSTSGKMQNNSAAGYEAGISIGIDGATPVETWSAGIYGAAPVYFPASCSYTTTALAEGYHYATILGYACSNTSGTYGTTGGTSTYFGGSLQGLRTTISGTIG